MTRISDPLMASIWGKPLYAWRLCTCRLKAIDLGAVPSGSSPTEHGAPGETMSRHDCGLHLLLQSETGLGRKPRDPFPRRSKVR
jgi:hypothetical protein